jgi:hypothetical protein
MHAVLFSWHAEPIALTTTQAAKASTFKAGRQAWPAATIRMMYNDHVHRQVLRPFFAVQTLG